MKFKELNSKIANGEEVPKKIRIYTTYGAMEMKYDHNEQDYVGYFSNGTEVWLFPYLFSKCRSHEHFRNMEVEVIDEVDELENK